MIKIWGNTKTLDGFVDELTFTDKKDEADIALLGSKSIQINDFKNLKGIFRVGVSRYNIPINEAKEKNIKVRFPSNNTINCIYEETANFTSYLIFKMLYKKVGSLDPWIKLTRKSLNRKKLLVVGFGNTGKRIFSKMQHFMDVSTYDENSNSLSDLNELLSSADCVSLHIPNSPENKEFIDKEKLAMMKNDCVLINTSRGAIVSEEALYDELRKKRLYAAFDVFWQEPYDGRLKEFHPERFFMTPHVASTCEDFLQGAAEDLKLFSKEIEIA